MPDWVQAMRERCAEIGPMAGTPPPPCEDFSRSVARMFSRMDEEDRSAFNECIFLARGPRPSDVPALLALVVELGTYVEDVSATKHDTDLVYWATRARGLLAKYHQGPGATTGGGT